MLDLDFRASLTSNNTQTKALDILIHLYILWFRVHSRIFHAFNSDIACNKFLACETVYFISELHVKIKIRS